MTFQGTTTGGREWKGHVNLRRGIRVVHVDVIGTGGYGVDCQWDASPLNRNRRAPDADDMEQMANDAEQRFVSAASAHG